MGFQTVCIDNLQAGFLAGEYLFEQGHRRMGFLQASPIFTNILERRTGLRVPEDISLIGICRLCVF